MTGKDLHCYEPQDGHSLKYHLFNVIIVRSAGWISSRDPRGTEIARPD